METLLTYGLLAGCIICFTFQGFFGKLYAGAYRGEQNAATPVFACIYGLIVGVSVLAAALGFRFAPSAPTWILGIVNGFMLFLYNLGMINASRTGPFSLQSIFRLLGGVVIPLLFSVLYWGDSLTALQLAGIAVMLVSFVAINMDGEGMKGMQRSYIGWTVLLFVVNGVYGAIMDSQQRIMAGAQRNEMIVVTFLCSSLVSLVYLAATQKKAAPSAFRMSKKAWLYAVGGGVSAALAVVQMMVMLSRMPAAIYYTVSNGMVLVLSVLLSAVLLKEKLTRQVLIGIALSVISLVLLSA